MAPSDLQTKAHRDLLDIVDRLRSHGLSRYVDLPQIIVCGDQSSGKSSALEAISGMSFPTKDNLCTRFATELILRRAPDVKVEVSITPGPERSDEEKGRLKSFGYTASVVDLDIGVIVEDAKSAMGLTDNTKVFSTDTLRVEISGPSQSNVTIVDLPGLFLAGNKDQSEEDSALVESLVLSYMRKPRTVILAVVSAKSDFALQQVTRHARALDPLGARTLGLITKPDTLDKGSDSERFFVELAQNKDVEFRLGWHVLRNRNYKERDVSIEVRNANEENFFSTGIWTTLKASQLGAAKLKTRLSNVLGDQILQQLPSVLDDVNTGIKECENTLARLGDSRATLAEQKHHLLRVGADFSRLVKASVDGEYMDEFLRESYDRRIRAVMQNTLSSFADHIAEHGHAVTITDSVSLQAGSGGDGRPRKINRSRYLEDVKERMKETRGRELPGTYNPLIVAELFSKQCAPWSRLVNDLVDRAFRLVFSAIDSIVRHVANDETAEALLHTVIRPAMQEIKAALAKKVNEVLEPHISGHPITYNHYLTETVQKIQASRNRDVLKTCIESHFDSLKSTQMGSFVTAQNLLDSMVAKTEPNMDTYACSMATDMMEAYYKVARKNIVDDVSVLVIEQCLLQKLPTILSTDAICALADEEVNCIAAESEDSMTERLQTSEKLGILEDSAVELKRLRVHGGAANTQDA